MKTEELTTRQFLLFSMGETGRSLSMFMIGSLVMYFYFPPTEIFPPYIMRSVVFMGMTIIGLANFGGRIFDAVTDPLIATMTDRCRSKFGRRRIFMMISFLPFSFLPLLIFTPPQTGVTVGNAVYLCLLLLVYYWFSTMYTQAWNALIPEITHTDKQQMRLATYVAIAWSIGFVIGQAVYLLVDVFMNAGMTSVNSFKLIIGIFGIICAVCLGVPIFVIDEKKHCHGHVSTESSFKAIATAFKNKNFLFYVLAEFCYFVAVTFTETGAVYYVTLLMGLEESMATYIVVGTFVLSLMCYYPINKIVPIIGNKRMYMAGLVLMLLQYCIMALVPVTKYPVVTGIISLVISSAPMAIFCIMPTIFLADLARADAVKTGNHKEAVFVGARGFAQKAAVSLTNLVFPSFLLLRSIDDNPTTFGATMTAVFASCVIVLGMIFFSLYNEKEVNDLVVQSDFKKESEIK